MTLLTAGKKKKKKRQKRMHRIRDMGTEAKLSTYVYTKIQETTRKTRGVACFT